MTEVDAERSGAVGTSATTLEGSGRRPASGALQERRSGVPHGIRRIGRTSGRIAGPGAAVIFLSLVVFVPIAAVVSQAFSGGWNVFWAEVTNPLSWDALKFTLVSALIVVAINTVAGTAIAWVLVRDQFFGKRIVAGVVDLPFALPTVIAGLTLLSLYGPDSPFHLDIVGARIGVWTALAFVTLPFAVRAVQPVLEELEPDAEEAAASLGASSFTVFRRVVLPSLAPAMLTGAGLAFARALGEYGSLVLIVGTINVASIRIFGLYESDDTHAAAALAFALLAMSLIVLLLFGTLRRYLARDGRIP